MADATDVLREARGRSSTPTVMREVERQVMLRIIDQRWREHLEEMDYLKEGINLRAMGQKDPLTEWQREGFEMFGSMMKGIAQDFVRYVMHVQVVRASDAVSRRSGIRSQQTSQAGAADGCSRSVAAPAPQLAASQIGRTPGTGDPEPATSSSDTEQVSRSARQQPPPVRRAPARPVPAPRAAEAKQQTVVKDEWSKTPRNAPCPCGSGKKFKICHGAGLTRVDARPRMRDFSDDLKELRRRLDEAGGVPEGRPSRAAGCPSSRPRWRVPTCGTTQTTPRRSTPSTPTSSDDLDTYDSLSQQLDDAEVLHEMAREEDDESQEPEIEAAIAVDRRRRSTSSICAACSPASTTRPTASCRSTPRTAASTPRTGARCCCACTSAGPSGAASRSRARRGLRGHRGRASCRPSSRSTGRYAYGLMTGERGTHRLVRISPFDNQGRRQTSFAAVQVWPVIDDPDVEINDADIRMEVFRARGAGGQHINKTSSAVRLIHEPTGMVAELPGGAQPAAEPGEGAGPAEGDGGRQDRGGARRPSSTRIAGGKAGPGRLGQPDPQLRRCSRTRW